MEQKLINIAGVGEIPLNEHTAMLLQNLDSYLNQEGLMDKVAPSMCSIIRGDIITLPDQSYVIITEVRDTPSVHAKGNFFIRGKRYRNSEWEKTSGYINAKYWDLHFLQKKIINIYRPTTRFWRDVWVAKAMNDDMKTIERAIVMQWKNKKVLKSTGFGKI